jgi:hypothetical protein
MIRRHRYVRTVRLNTWLAERCAKYERKKTHVSKKNAEGRKRPVGGRRRPTTKDRECADVCHPGDERQSNERNQCRCARVVLEQEVRHGSSPYRDKDQPNGTGDTSERVHAWFDWQACS